MAKSKRRTSKRTKRENLEWLNKGWPFNQTPPVSKSKPSRRKNPKATKRYQIFAGETKTTMHYVATRTDRKAAFHFARGYAKDHPYMRVAVRKHPDDRKR